MVYELPLPPLPELLELLELDPDSPGMIKSYWRALICRVSCVALRRKVFYCRGVAAVFIAA